MKVISVVFHPLLMATYTCIWLYVVFPQIFSPIAFHSIPYFISAVFITTFLVPMLSLLFMKATQKVSSLEITQREERSLPFLSITAFYGVSTYLFKSKLHISYSMTVMMVTVTVLIGLILLISMRYKISVHAAGAWGVAGLLSALTVRYLNTTFILSLAPVILVAGITSASRLYLNRHRTHEVWSGAILGFLLCFLCFYFFG